ncbi:hypothetical protein [Flavobacterium silvaticum]|uniref:Carboxypeptidase-like regulatory domain-containing protein n=1 Tax=Flavobacterium silvaticum TaxID=1852020 RepID=A0A972FKS7_9FLAO|nr:hypothetical protein [Flavobacterium silvaticum]NMH27497.1 hypothetical protein [Flavobacterium silvaticum]
MRSIFTFLLLTFSLFIFAQSRKPVQGRITIGTLVATNDEVNIRNLQTKKSTATSNGGYFTIQAKAADTLYITSNEFPAIKYVLSALDMNQDLVELKINTGATQLSQVTVESIPSSKSLGIEPADKKKYSKAERKLKSSTTSAVQRDGDKAYTAISTDRVINAISGQTSDAKKEVATEKKEATIAKLSEMHPENYYTETLKIPVDYVKGFQFYAAEDPKFVKIVEAGNDEDIDFELSKLAPKYLNTLKDGQK